MCLLRERSNEPRRTRGCPTCPRRTHGRLRAPSSTWSRASSEHERGAAVTFWFRHAEGGGTLPTRRCVCRRSRRHRGRSDTLHTQRRCVRASSDEPLWLGALRESQVPWAGEINGVIGDRRVSLRLCMGAVEPFRVSTRTGTAQFVFELVRYSPRVLYSVAACRAEV